MIAAALIDKMKTQANDWKYNSGKHITLIN